MALRIPILFGLDLFRLSIEANFETVFVLLQNDLFSICFLPHPSVGGVSISLFGNKRSLKVDLWNMQRPFLHPTSYSAILAVLLAGKLFANPSDKGNLKLNGLSLGFGDWITFTDQHASTREDYGTLAGLGLYGSGWGWNASMSLPLKSTFKRLRHETRISLGDGEFSLGRQLGPVSPRVSLKVPLYTWSVENASENELFVGSGNLQLGVGLGMKLPKAILPSRFSAGADIEVSAAITEALADYGSSHAAGSLHASFAATSRLRLSVTSLFLFDYWRWVPNYWDQKAETKISIVPGISVGYRFFQALYVDLKGGFSAYDYRYLYEPKYPIRPQSSYYLSLSFYQGLK
jgi:hypothetical protein